MTAAWALSLAAIAAWASGIVPGAVTALAFFALAMVTGAAPAATVFSGFASTAFWLIFGGLVLGVAIRRSGLGEVAADRLIRLFGPTYAGNVVGMSVLGLLLSFAMPSSLGRAALLIPIALSLADRAGFAPGRPGRTGIVVATAFGTHLPSFAILPANVPNAVMAGHAEALFGLRLEFGRYLLLHFPVLGLLKAALLVGLVLLFFRDRPDAAPAPATQPRPLTAEQRKVAALLAATVALLCTDAWHHLPAAWVSLSAAVLCLLPPLRLVPPPALETEVSHSALFQVAGLIGLGAVVAESGLGRQIAQWLLLVLPVAPGNDWGNFWALSALPAAVGLLTTLPGIPAVATPLAPDLAAASGLPVETVLMLQVVGFSTPLAIYQSPPLLVSLHMAKQKLRPLVPFWLAFTGLTVAVLLPLDFLWLRVLGFW